MSKDSSDVLVNNSYIVNKTPLTLECDSTEGPIIVFLPRIPKKDNLGELTVKIKNKKGKPITLCGDDVMICNSHMIILTGNQTEHKFKFDESWGEA